MAGAAASPDPLQPLVDTLRHAFQSVAERALETPQSSSAGSSFTGDRGPVETAESHLGAAFAAGEIYERLVQLEAMAAPSILLDWIVLKQAAMSAARAAIDSAEALLPSLQDAGTVARIKAGTAEIEAKLSGKPVASGK
jgi:hypothetical protein